MDNVISLEEYRFGKDVLGLYQDSLSGCTDKEREFIEKSIINPMIPDLKKRLRAKGLEISFTALKENVDFYDTLFDTLCDSMISFSPLAINTSDEFKAGIKAHLYESRDTDKDRIYYDYGEGIRPSISEFEFEPLRMLGDIEFYFDQIVEESSTGIKK